MQVEIEALRSIEREKNVDFERVIEALEGSLESAYKRSTDAQAEEARVIIDRGSGEVTVYAQQVDELGNVLSEWQHTPRDFGRIVAQTAKQVLTQRLREAERELTFGEYSGKEGDLVSGILQRYESRVTLDLGNAEAVLPSAEQVTTERYSHGQRLHAYVTEVRRSMRGPQVVASRTHPNLVEALFRREVPEIADGVVLVHKVARDPGHRTKIAVSSLDESVDPVGSCVGARGSRVRAIVDELNQEKIDIVVWSDEPAELVANALSPAKVEVVYLYPEDATALVVVPDYQLSLAIGREGQNARLTARLTGWRVDIKSETQFNEEQTAFQSAYERGEVDEYGTPLTRAGEAALPDPDASVWEPTSEGVATAVGEPGASPASPESDSGR